LRKKFIIFPSAIDVNRSEAQIKLPLAYGICMVNESLYKKIAHEMPINKAGHRNDSQQGIPCDFKKIKINT
jgi:hypothetical protein